MRKFVSQFLRIFFSKNVFGEIVLGELRVFEGGFANMFLIKHFVEEICLGKMFVGDFFEGNFQ